jgi:DNA-binding NarL/FixJ family response regulator
VRVAVAEDGLLFREGLARLLAEGGFTVVASCADLDELLTAVESDPPDVAIVDMRMPPTHTDEGVRAAHAIRARSPSVGVLVLSSYAEPGLAMELLGESVEGLGYMLKDRVHDLDEFAAAVRRVAAGGSAIDPSIVSMLLRRDRDPDPLAVMTPRELEVLSLMAEGRTNQAIAERLAVTERAVQKHITSIFQRLGLGASDDDHRRVLAVLAFLNAHPVG